MPADSTSEAHRLWTMQDVEPIAGIKAWMVDWLIRQGVVELDEAERGDVNVSGRGRRRRFSEPTIMELAITGQGHAGGLEWADAYYAARRFTLLGGACPVKGCGVEREPGEPFAAGETYLIASPVSGDSAIVHDCIASPDPLGAILSNAGLEIDGAFQDGAAPVVIVNLVALSRRVRDALNNGEGR